MTHESTPPRDDAAETGDLTYRAAAADRAAKIAALVAEIIALRGDRDDMAHRIDKLERRLARVRDKLDRRDKEVSALRTELAAALSPPPVPTGVVAKNSLVRRLRAIIARGIRVSA
ncbi:MAG: hypothetical protein LBK59_06745 [Bifidobacteriaceae bacterium]|jgi:hypothetical protein|nr:hypothetical protein [Bifidobacteriaceae bacterium]